MSRLIDAERFDVFDSIIPEQYDTESFMAGMEVVLDAIKDAPTIESTVDKDYLIRLIQEAVYDGEACARLIGLVDGEASHAYYFGWCNGEEAEATRHDDKWIPCEERLPDSIDVLVCYEDDIWIDWLGYGEGDIPFWYESGESIGKTAWMPLPQPYHSGEATEMVEPQTDPCDGCVCDDGKHLMYCMNCNGIAWKTEPPKVENEPQTERSNE